MLHGQGERERERVRERKAQGHGHPHPHPGKGKLGRGLLYTHHYPYTVDPISRPSFHSCSDFGFDFGSHFRFVYFRSDSLGFGVVYAARKMGKAGKWEGGKGGKLQDEQRAHENRNTFILFTPRTY